jgi:hypothetical protein
MAPDAAQIHRHGFTLVIWSAHLLDAARSKMLKHE